MTKARAPSTFADAVTRIAGRVGWAAMSEAVGKSERAVRNWSDPDMDRDPTIDEALILDAAYLAAGGGEAPIMAVYQLRLDRAVTPRADTAALALATGLAAKEVGEAVAAAVQIVNPGASQADCIVADREIGEAVEALTALRQKLGVGANVTTLRAAS